jgi:hypothetical protein
LTSRLERTVVSEIMIEDDLNHVEESVTKSTYKLGVGFERCEDKGEKSAPKFVPSFNYYNEEETIKSNKAHYPSNPKPSFNPKREVRKETPKPRVEVFICMFCGHAGHLDEFFFHCKRIEKRRFDYARNSYHNEFIDFLPRTYSRASFYLFHGPNHRSYTLVMTHILIVVIVPCVGTVFQLDGLILALSPDTWTIHVFPIMVHIPLVQMVRYKRL